MMLQASELGLGTVWVCYFKPDILSQEFNLSANLEPVNMNTGDFFMQQTDASMKPVNILVIGYADEEPADPDRHGKTRIPLDTLVAYEKFS